MPKLRVRELSSHYCGNKFRTTRRIVKPSLLSPAVKGILVGSRLDNLSFGIGEVPSMVIVLVVAGMNFSSDRTTFTAFSSHSLALSQQSTSNASHGIINDITERAVFEDAKYDLVMLTPVRTSNKGSTGAVLKVGRLVEGNPLVRLSYASLQSLSGFSTFSSLGMLPLLSFFSLIGGSPHGRVSFSPSGDPSMVLVFSLHRRIPPWPSALPFIGVCAPSFCSFVSDFCLLI